MAVSQEGSGDKKIGFGVIGTGMQANILTVPILANPHAEVVGLCEIREGVAEAFAERHGLSVPIFEDYRDLLKMDGLDAVIVTTSNEVHGPISVAAVEAGKHTLCEKPMTTDLADARAMVAAQKKSDVRTMIGYTKRFFRGTRFLYDFLQREDLGRVYHVRAFYFQSWLCSPRAPVVWRLERARTGTGVLGDLAAHVTDLSQYLAGDEIVRVSGMMRTFYPERPSLADPGKKQVVDVDDGVVYGAEFKNGALGTIEATRNGTGHPDHWRVEILGEKAAVVYDNVDRRVQLAVLEGPSRYAGWVDLPVPPYRYGNDGMENQNEIDHFIESIGTGKDPRPTFEEGLKTERVLDAVNRSAQAGKAMDVEM